MFQFLQHKWRALLHNYFLGKTTNYLPVAKQEPSYLDKFFPSLNMVLG